MKLNVIVLILFSMVSFSAFGAKCADFDTQAEAQRFFESGVKGSKRLDGDKDGEACECLKGGSSYNDSICKRFREKYGK